MNNWAVILGSSSGIGRQCAIELAKNKINIFGVYLRKPKNYIEELDLALLMTVNPGFGGQKFIADVLPKISEMREII